MFRIESKASVPRTSKDARFSVRYSRLRGYLVIFIAAIAVLGGTSQIGVHGFQLGTAVSAQSLGRVAIVRGNGATLYDRPDGQSTDQLSLGTPVTVIGRSADGDWAAIETNDGSTGWTLAQDLRMIGFDDAPILNADDELAGAGELSTGAASPEATATSMPTATMPPTPTPVPTATPIPTVMPAIDSSELSATSGMSGAPNTVSPVSSQVAVVRSPGTALLASPSGEMTAELPTATALTITGRSEQGDYFAALTPSGMRGWVAASDVVAFNTGQLPIVDPNALAQANSGGAASQSDSMQNEAAVNAQEVESETTADIQVTEFMDAVVNLSESRLNIRKGPDTSYAIIAKAQPSEVFVATGTNADGTWIQLAGGQLDDKIGWAASEYIDLSGSQSNLPVSTELSTAAVIVQPSSTSASGSSANSINTPTGMQGNLIVQTRSGGDIYVVDLASGAKRLLTTGFDPAISPDGTTVAFTRSGGDKGLYLIDIDGSNERLIYSGGEGLGWPTFSPDGTYVAFSRYTGEWKCRDVGFGICLPDGPFMDSFPLVRKPEHGMSRVNVNGGDFRDLPVLMSAKAPSWGPNGIVYQSNTSIEVTQDEPGATTTAVLKEPYYQDPDWQPNTNLIAFQSREGTHWEIFVVNEDGSGMYPLTRPVTTLVDQLPSNVAPAWSPDGHHIVYLSSRDENNSEGPWRIWVMNADGSGQRPLGIDLPIEYNYAAEQALDWGIVPTN